MAVAAVLAAACAPASAAAPPEWSQKADEIAAPWPALQQADGSFRDYVLVRDPNDQRDDYGDAILGYGLLLSAARSGNAQLADSALRALEYALDRAARSPSTQVFHQLATVSAYNLARRRFPDHPVFQRARARWEEMMRRIEVYRLGRQKVTNKSIVEAILLLELVASGHSSDPAGMRAAVRRFLAHELPEASRRYRGVLGDLPLLPPAYHGLSVGMLARTVELLGSEAPSEARALLSRGAAASLRAASPNGEAAYHGRSQSEAWALTLTAHGAPRLAARMIGRLVELYPTTTEGLMVTPSLAQSIDAALPGIDEYVAGASYTGLTLMALEWLIASDPSAAPASSPSAAVVGSGPGAWAVSRRGSVWFAVKRTRTSTRDLRYDFGLVALEAGGGELPLRPRTVAGHDSAGPVLNSAGYPEGTDLRLGSKGRVVVRGGFRTRSGRWLRRGVTFTFTPTKCGVRLTLPEGRYGYSAFFRGEPKRSGRTVRDAEQQIRFDRAPRLELDGKGYASGADTGLTRARMRVRTASIETCLR